MKGCFRRYVSVVAFVLLPGASADAVAGQGRGTVSGTVIRAEGGAPLPDVTVSVSATRFITVTDPSGTYVLRGVPAGEHTLVFRRIGYALERIGVTVSDGGTHTVDAALDVEAIRLDAVTVEGASRVPERVVEAPAAISVVDPRVVEETMPTSQVPRALARLPGTDVVQSGMYDFNVNARGFNTSLQRRMLVLQDGRDVSLGFLGIPVWSGMGGTLDEAGHVEMLRGPSAALYGANASSGVITFTTPPAREAVGTRLSLTGGGLGTLRGDARHAGVFGNGRFGYKLMIGRSQSDSWSVARTHVDGGDMRREYAPATADPVPDVVESLPLHGQTLDPATHAALGDPEQVTNTYGSARFDVYPDDGSVLTAEAGTAFVENEVYVIGSGRGQFYGGVHLPWARLMWAADRFNVTAWYSHEDYRGTGRLLEPGVPFDNLSNRLHAEARYNQPILQGRGLFVVGASAQRLWIDTRGTILTPETDARSDGFYSAYGQLEYNPVPELRLVAAARFDDSDLFASAFSPRVAVVYSPTDGHSLRLTASRAYLTPTHTDILLQLPYGAPQDFTALEAALRESDLGPALVDVPEGELYTNSAAVPIWGLGNDELGVNGVTSLELGYKGWVANRALVTVDAYYSRMSDFITDFLPGVSSAYGPWTAPEEVPEEYRAAVEAATTAGLLEADLTQFAAGLTRLADGATSVVYTAGNVGQADEWGLELGAAWLVTPEVQIDGNYTLFLYDIDESSLEPGVQIDPNTPRNKGNLSVSYTGRQGFDARVSARFIEKYDWAAGRFEGVIPASQTFDVSAAYQASRTVRVHAMATNVFDQLRYQMYGGSVIGRRVLAGLTVSF